MSRWLALVDPLDKRQESVARRVRDVLTQLEIPIDAVTPASVSEAKSLISSEALWGRTRFVAVGGDRTANLVVNALMDLDWDEPPLLGLLPTQGSDFLRMFGIPQTLEEAAPHLGGEARYTSDVGVLEGSWGRRYFLNVSQAGLGAAANRRVARLPFRSASTRQLAALTLTLPTFSVAEIQLETERHTYEGRALAVILANGQFSNGLNVAPRATLVDGRLDVQVITLRKRDTLALLRRMRRGTHLKLPSVTRRSSSRFRLTSNRAWPISVDGEYLGSTPLTGRIGADKIDIKI